MIEPAIIAEVKRRTALAELIGEGPHGVALKPVRRRGEWKGLCPFHAERTPSFYVIEDKGFWHCFGCGLHGDAVEWVRRTTDARNFTEAIEVLAARVGLGTAPRAVATKPIIRRPAAEMLAAREKQRIETARIIWSTSQSALWTPAEAYLRGRGLRVALPPTLRFVPALAHPHAPQAGSWPALVACVQGPDDAEDGRKIVGVHCTYLPRPNEAGDAKGRARPPAGWRGHDPAREWKTKIMRGRCGGGAVRLAAAEEVVIVAEGIETAMSLYQAHFNAELGHLALAGDDDERVAVWAALSLGNMGRLWLPPQVREVILAADGDGKRPDAARVQAIDPDSLIEQAAALHRAQGRNVRIARPPAGSDFNDLLAPGAGAAPRDDVVDEEIAA